MGNVCLGPADERTQESLGVAGLSCSSTSGMVSEQQQTRLLLGGQLDATGTCRLLQLLSGSWNHFFSSR